MDLESLETYLDTAKDGDKIPLHVKLELESMNRMLGQSFNGLPISVISAREILVKYKHLWGLV